MMLDVHTKTKLDNQEIDFLSVSIEKYSKGGLKYNLNNDFDLNVLDEEYLDKDSWVESFEQKKIIEDIDESELNKFKIIVDTMDQLKKENNINEDSKKMQ